MIRQRRQKFPRPSYLDPAVLDRAAKAGDERLAKRVRRVRMCSCPHCGSPTPLAPKARGEDLYMTICQRCYMAFTNDAVPSWLEDPV